MQMLTRSLSRSLAAVAALTLSATAATAQPKAPDFTGQWELNVAKSDFGPMAGQGPTKGSMIITQNGPALKLVQALSTPMGDQNNTQELTLDGQERAVSGADGQPTTTTAKVDGEAVIVNSKLTRQGMDITMNSRWTVSPDGKLLTVDRQFATSMGAMAMKMVYDKK